MQVVLEDGVEVGGLVAVEEVAEAPRSYCLAFLEAGATAPSEDASIAGATGTT